MWVTPCHHFIWLTVASFISQYYKNININFLSRDEKELDFFLFFNLKERLSKLWDKERKSIILALTFVWMASPHRCYWHHTPPFSPLCRPQSIQVHLAGSQYLSGVTVSRHSRTSDTFFCNDQNNSYRDNLVFLLQKLNLTAACSQENKNNVSRTFLIDFP